MTFDTFDLSIFVESDFQSVDHAIRTKAGLESWFLKRVDFVDTRSDARGENELVAVGDAYWWEWFDGTIEQGNILTSGEGFLEFSFGRDTTVTLESEPVGDGVLVKLSQIQEMRDDELRQRAYVSCIQAWTFFLANLKAYLEHKVDLREKAPTRKDHLNV